jgi:hypothetical protein
VHLLSYGPRWHLIFATGRKGLGLGPKRPASPTSSTSRPIKLARLENEEKEAYRDRVRADYEERRAEGKLISATKTCITLDDKSGLKVRVATYILLLRTY